MLSFVIISPRYSESGTPTGVMTHALAAMLHHFGHNVRVICSMSPAPRISHERLGGLAIDRINIRPKAPGLLFAAEASRRLYAQIPKHCPRTVICVDCPEVEWVYSSLSMPHPQPPQFFHIHTGDEQSRSHTTQSVRENSNTPELNIPVPLCGSIWELPSFDGRTLFVPDARTDEQRSFIVRCFRESGADRAGWSLALPEDDGRWSIIVNSRGTSGESCSSRFLLAPFSNSPVLPIYALKHGVLSMICESSPLASHWPSSVCIQAPIELAQAIKHMISEPDTRIQRWIHDLSDRLLPSHQPRTVYAEALSAIESHTAPQNQSLRISMWKEIEAMPMILRGELA